MLFRFAALSRWRGDRTEPKTAQDSGKPQSSTRRGPGQPRTKSGVTPRTLSGDRRARFARNPSCSFFSQLGGPGGFPAGRGSGANVPNVRTIHARVAISICSGLPAAGWRWLSDDPRWKERGDLRRIRRCRTGGALPVAGVRPARGDGEPDVTPISHPGITSVCG